MNQNRRQFLSSISAAFGASIVGCSNKSDSTQSDPPNIILCMADDQGWGDVAYNGHNVLQTPNLDAMANSGLRFDRFYAAAPVCSPTRGSVMTGRHPNRFGCFTWGNTLRPQEVTIAEKLKSAGYKTGHFGKWHLGSVYADSPVSPGACGFDEWFSAPNFFENNPILSRKGRAEQTEGESSMVVMDAAIDFIREQSGASEPFFTVIWFGSPHKPHEAIDEDRLDYENEPVKLQHFYGEITGIDRAVGKLRKTLRDLQIHENTIFWYCSDNGGLPEVGSTGGRGHKGHVYEGGLRVPAILEWPSKISSAMVSDIPANTSDILPTLCDIVGLAPEKSVPLDGLSLLPVLNAESAKRNEPMGFWHYPEQGVKTPSKTWMADMLEEQTAGESMRDSFRLRADAAEIKKPIPENTFSGHAAWLDWPWKLHRIQKKNGNVKLELYDLQQDSMESNDLSNELPDRAISMQTALENWMNSVIRSHNGGDYV